MATTSPEPRCPGAADPEADRLIATDGNALLIGFVLDQQVTVQKAFSGPLELQQRLGHLDPGRIAATDPGELRDLRSARSPPSTASPAAMARRVQSLCAVAERATTATAPGSGPRPPRAADLKARLARCRGSAT